LLSTLCLCTVIFFLILSSIIKKMFNESSYSALLLSCDVVEEENSISRAMDREVVFC